MKAGRRGGILWVTRDNTTPHPYLVEACRRAGGEVRELRWAEEFDGQRPMGRFVELGRRTGRTHPMSVKLVSPRLLARFARAAEDVVIIYELGLVGFYAGLSKLVRRRGLISLVEGDYRHLGRTGTAGAKVALRRLAARSVDLFIANNPPARDYLIETLKVPRSRIVTGWWLAGLPADLPARMPAGVTPAPDGAPLFVCAGRLIVPKGIDLLIEAVAIHRRETGPCTLWIIGDGPEREHLAELARRLAVEDLFTGYYETVLERTELITEVHVPAQDGRKGAYCKVTTGSADDWPALGVAAVIDGDGTAIKSARIVASAATDKATRLKSAEAVLNGRTVTDTLLEEAGDAAVEESEFIADIRGSVPYKRELMRVYVRRAVRAALDGRDGTSR